MIGARPRLIVAEIIPGITVVAVILPHRAPLAFAEVWSPFFPRSVAVSGCFESLLFGIHGGILSIGFGKLLLRRNSAQGRVLGLSLLPLMFVSVCQSVSFHGWTGRAPNRRRARSSRRKIAMKAPNPLRASSWAAR